MALRSYGRRFRRLAEESESPAAVLPAAAAAAAAIEAVAKELERVLRTDEPTVSVPDVGADADVGDRAGALERLERAGADLVAATERVDPDDWRRRGRTAGGSAVDVLDLVRTAVHAGAHQLRLAQRAAGPAASDEG